MNADIAVQPTEDEALMRRWLLRPAFFTRVGGAGHTPAALDAAFGALRHAKPRVFAVWVRGEEKGCIVFREGGGWRGRWELHLCLGTFFTHTRVALAEALRLMHGTAAIVEAAYPAARRALDLLLNDVGFASGPVIAGRRIRVFCNLPSSL